MNRTIWSIPYDTLLMMALVILAVIAMIAAFVFFVTMVQVAKRKRAEDMLIRNDTLEFAQKSAKAMQAVEELTRRQVDLQIEILRHLHQLAEASKQGSQGI